MTAHIIKPFSTTGIGSLPHTDPDEACRLILETFDIPFWPQLPALSFLEGMIAQYSEGMPFMEIDMEKCSIWVAEDRGDELDRFYESYKDDTLIAISEDYAKGLHAFLRLLGHKKFQWLKGHMTGPLTFTLGLREKEGRLVYFNEELREISLMLLKAKIRWQARMLKPHAEGIIIFIDEPILSALGSPAYMGVKRDEVLRLLKETVSAIKDAGALAGIHCCGRTDWTLILETGIDILNFDAYEYADTLAIYPDEVKRFLEKGGILAWGIIPTTEAIREETPEKIKKRFYEKLDGLSKHIPSELLLENIMLTPSCGTGSRTVEETLKVFHLLRGLKEEVS